MSTLSDKIKTGARHPFRFIGRQLYRVFIILPYEAVVGVVAWIVLSKNNTNTVAEVETCIFVTSLIYVKDRKLTYGVRSVFNAEKRAEQTLATIKSIRERAPAATIVLIEAGLREDIPAAVRAAADTYIYVGGSKLVRLACDSPFKSLGETVLLLAGYKALPNAKRYFKMSGRYWLNNEFNQAAWQGDNFSFYYIRTDFISTRLYSFSIAAKRRWRFALIKSLPYLFLDYPIEFLLPKFVAAKYITKINRVGVSGLDGVTGAEIKE